MFLFVFSSGLALEMEEITSKTIYLYLYAKLNHIVAVDQNTFTQLHPKSPKS